MIRLSPAARAGIRDIAPILLGLVPFGLITGVSGAAAGITAVDMVIMSALVYAGASQLAAVSLMGASAAPWVVLLTVGLINLRFLMYSASLAPWVQRYGPGARALMAYLLVDHTYALSVIRYAREDESFGRRDYYLAMGVVVWVQWSLMTALGAVLSAQLPPALHLDFAVPLSFLALLVPLVTTRPTLAAAVTGAALAIVLAPLPYSLGMVIATLVGVAAGTLTEAIVRSRRAGSERADPDGAPDGVEEGVSPVVDGP